MDTELLKGFLRFGFVIGGCGLLMVFFQPPNSAEFFLSLCSALMGGALILGVVLISRFFRSRERFIEPKQDEPL